MGLEMSDLHTPASEQFELIVTMDNPLHDPVWLHNHNRIGLAPSMLGQSSNGDGPIRTMDCEQLP